MKILKVLSIALAAIVVMAAGFLFSGAFNVAADSPHWGVTRWLLATARERSVAARSGDIRVPPLDDTMLITMGAGHYSEMCTGCHLAPGINESEQRRGLYPMPPNLIEHGRDHSPQEQFWIIKHGFKMTAMPAWGTTHDDHSIWAMVAFLRKLPALSPTSYRALVAQDQSQPSHDEHAASPVAVVDQFFGALASGDTTAASALLDPAVLIYESGGVERSSSEYAAEHLGADAAFLKSATHRLISRGGDAVGDLAWVATESHLTTQGAKPVDMVSTETMVLRKQPAGWRIVHVHWSSRRAAQ